MTSRAEWQKRIEEYRQSGLSQNAWRKSRGIPHSTLQYHLRRLERGEQKKFVELKPPPQGIKLHWKNITLELDPDFDEKTLLRFLNVLR